jgi:ribulose-5-phosphate 4-epimerase/fuculose-1-phosphate aldolase
MTTTNRNATTFESAADAEHLVRLAREMVVLGLVTGTAGNLSVRLEDGTVLVTPSGVDYATLRADQLVPVGLDGQSLGADLKPSVDTMTHVAIYRARDDVRAVIHTHSLYAAAFSALHRPIPALLTEPAGFLGGAVRVMDYLPPASPELGYQMADGIGQDRAVLMPNHGVMAVGETPLKAFHAAVAVEESAHVAFLAEQLGTPFPVPDGEVERMNTFIHHRYGQR